ncbi:hypothetical protein EDD21DRAFT_382931 [Dissophora ornata]|nr:hypothetical protein EDD21DRAFT_382931 [Dissophora ornata]
MAYVPQTAYTPQTAYVPQSTYVPQSKYVPPSSQQQQQPPQPMPPQPSPPIAQQPPQPSPPITQQPPQQSFQQPPQQPFQQPPQQPFQQPLQQTPQQQYQLQQQFQPQQQYQPLQPYQQPPQLQMQQQQQQPFNPRQSSYPPPPRIVEQQSPSMTVSALGILSPIQQQTNGMFGMNTTSPPFPPSSNGDRAPSPSPFIMGDRPPSPSRTSSSSDESRAQRFQHLRASSTGQAGGFGAGGRVSPLPLGNTNNSDFLKPIPTRSEDWGALLDTPASPTMPFPSNGMRFQNAAQFMTGYTDSPAEEANLSSDYMQHVSLQQGRRRSMPFVQQHAMTDPTPMQHRQGFHQHHNSISGMPLPYSGNRSCCGAY